MYIGPVFGLPFAKQMVSHSPRNLQRGYVFVPWVFQNRLSGLQCHSLPGSADRWTKRTIQQSSTGWDEPVFLNLISYIERGEVRPFVAQIFPLEHIADAQVEFLDKKHVSNFVFNSSAIGLLI